MSMNEVIRITKDWFSRDHTRLALGIGIFSAGLVGYSLGILRNSSVAEVPLAMSIVSPREATLAPTVLGDATSKKADGAVKPDVTVKTSVNCAFVGSKNSTLYHLPSCASARRIKEENKHCFTSSEDALARGYRPGCLK